MVTMTTTKRRNRSKPVRSGTASGRAGGSRDALSRSVLSALCRDFDTYGEAVIAAIRAKDPATYLKLCLQIMLKQDGGLDHPLAEMSNDELEYLEHLLGERRAHHQDQAQE